MKLKTIKETDDILVKLKLKSKKMNKKDFSEYILENQLLDSLLREVGRKQINEYSFLGALRGIFKQIFGQLLDNFKESLTGTYEHDTISFSSSVKDYSKISKRDPGEKLDPDKSPKDLVIFALSQMDLIESEDIIEKISEGINQLPSLETPVPDGDDSEEANKWKEGGEYYKILDGLSKAYGYCAGNAKFLAEILKKDWPEIEKNINDAGSGYLNGNKESNVLDLIKGIIIWCDGYQNSNWKTAMDKASEIKDDFEWAEGKKISSDYMLNGSAKIKSVLTAESSRLKSALDNVENNSEKDSQSDEDKTTGLTDESIKKVNMPKLETILLNDLLREINKN